MKWTTFTLAFAALFTAFLAPAPASAQAALSTNYRTIGDLSQEDCMSKARRVARASGLHSLPPTSAAVWVETSNRQLIASMFCISKQGIVVFSVAGRELRVTRPILEKLIDLWGDEN